MSQLDELSATLDTLKDGLGVLWAIAIDDSVESTAAENIDKIGFR